MTANTNVRPRKLEVYQRKNILGFATRRWGWRLWSGNGKDVIAGDQGQGYNDQSYMLKVASSVVVGFDANAQQLAEIDAVGYCYLSPAASTGADD